MFNNFKKAFTMAEVLMVLGIIGVVAAITIPNLKDSADEQFYVAKAAKVYSEMETAFSRATLKYGNSIDWNGIADSNIGTATGTKMVKYLDVTDTCGTGANARCWKNDYSTNATVNAAYKLALKDGTTLAFFNNRTLEQFKAANSNSLFVLMDLDGSAKGPNTMGIDQFYFFMLNNGTLNAGRWVAGNTPNSNSYLAWVLKFGNQDYMRCASSLSFIGNTSCK